MYEVIQTYLSRKSNTFFYAGEMLPEGYYDAQELKEALELGLIKASKPPDKKPVEKGPSDEEPRKSSRSRKKK